MVKVTIVQPTPKQIKVTEADLPKGFYYGQARGFAIDNPQLFLSTGAGLIFFCASGILVSGFSPEEDVNAVAVNVELVVTERR